jgi:hypothetical protein
MLARNLSFALPLLGLLSLVGCSEMSMYSKADYETEGAADSADEDWQGEVLRLDIYPSNQSASLLPETHRLLGDWEGVVLEMRSPVRLTGEITGFDATPRVTASVPGSESVPVVAQVTATKVDSIMYGGSQSRVSDGHFEFSVPAGSNYICAYVPQEPAELPFLVDAGRRFLSSEDISVDLGYGAPVWGRVANADDAPLVGVEVRLLDQETGVGGPIATTDALGFYMLRAYPGAYDIEARGRSGGYLPVFREELLVEDESGSRHDFFYAELQPSTVTGSLVQREGLPLGDVTVRFTAVNLAGFEDATLVLETDTDRNGNFSLQALPGRYEAQFIPAIGQPWTPVVQSVDVPEGSTSWPLDAITLSPFRTMRTRVVDARGSGVPNVGVMATDRDFDGFTYFATSDGLGNVALDIPDTSVELTLSPPQGVLAAVTRTTLLAGGGAETLMLDEGEPVSGTVTHEGEPVPWALVEIRDAENKLYGTTLTDNGGAFSIRVSWGP